MKLKKWYENKKMIFLRVLHNDDNPKDVNHNRKIDRTLNKIENMLVVYLSIGKKLKYK